MAPQYSRWLPPYRPRERISFPLPMHTDDMTAVPKFQPLVSVITRIGAHGQLAMVQMGDLSLAQIMEQCL